MTKALLQDDVPKPASEALVWLELDPTDHSLIRGDRRIALTRRAFSLLHCLMRHPNELVSKSDLLRSVWGGVVVEEGQVKQFVCELRALLRDDAAQPRFIETVRGLGYRYLGGIGMRDGSQRIDQERHGVAADSNAAGEESEISACIAPTTSLQRLWFDLSSGRRACCMLHGDARFADRLLSELARVAGTASLDSHLLAACCASACRDEPYSALLDALDARCAGNDGSRVLEAIRRCAPSWALQLPWRFSEREQDRLQRRCRNTSSGRMRREFGRLLLELAGPRPLILRIDNLHEADAATRVLVEYLTMQTAPARLLLLVTTQAPSDIELIDRTARRYSQQPVMRVERLGVLAVAAGMRLS